MIHGTPARVLAQHLGRNLRFKGSPLCDRPPSNIFRRQCRSRQVASEHARPVLEQRTMVVIEQTPCMCAGISVRNVRPHNARARVHRPAADTCRTYPLLTLATTEAGASFV